MSLKEHVPFALKHRLRQAYNSVRYARRNLATGSVPVFQSWYTRRRIADFLRPMLAPGELVFDVGANIGSWTDALVLLGCRVVAIEPQHSCAQAIVGRHRDAETVTVVEAAVSDVRGEIALYVAPLPEHATISRGWMTAMVERGGYPPGYWQEAGRVPARTLDDLIDEFGVPSYVKLDIEGAEAEALRALRTPVRLLSFETHGQTLDEASGCLEAITALGPYQFNLTPGKVLSLSWAHWGDATRLLQTLEAEPSGWNNVFACLEPNEASRR